jgi:hypothetical protein
VSTALSIALRTTPLVTSAAIESPISGTTAPAPVSAQRVEPHRGVDDHHREQKPRSAPKHPPRKRSRGLRPTFSRGPSLRAKREAMPSTA